jgi:flagellar export protein FliJ
MKSRETLIRLKKFQVDEKRRRVAQIEAMIADFERMASDLDREVANEERRAGISDPGHFAYPTYARASRARREKIIHSADELRGQLDGAKSELELAFEDLKKVEILQDREMAAERIEEQRREQIEMDRIGSRLRLRA